MNLGGFVHKKSLVGNIRSNQIVATALTQGVERKTCDPVWVSLASPVNFAKAFPSRRLVLALAMRSFWDQARPAAVYCQSRGKSTEDAILRKERPVHNNAAAEDAHSHLY